MGDKPIPPDYSNKLIELAQQGNLIAIEIKHDIPAYEQLINNYVQYVVYTKNNIQL